MLSARESKRALRRLFARKVVADLDTLRKTLKTSTRMSVYRRLRETGYLSSYTHGGRYYTLEDIPDFDEYGLWCFRRIGFSRFGTLRTTLVELVNEAEVGMKQGELRGLLRVKVQDPLLSLVRSGQIGREHMEGAFLYLSADVEKAEEQLSKRMAQTERAKRVPQATVIQVLVQAIHAGGVMVGPREVAARLNAQSIRVTVEQVQKVLAQYGLDEVKKTERFH